MKSNLLLTSFLSLMLSTALIASGETQDFFRSTGKINTVLAVVLILFFVLLFFLLRLDSKIGKIEKHINDDYKAS